MPTESVLQSYLEGVPQRNSEELGRRKAGGPLEFVPRDERPWRGLPPADNRRYAAGLANMHRGTITAERRQITAINGRALEILGHAIEYLADEYALSALQLGTLDSGDPRVEAVQLLILLNREVYFSNPEHEPLRRRLARWLFRGPALPAAEQPMRLNPRI